MSVIKDSITPYNHDQIYNRIKTKYKDFILSEAMRYPSLRAFTIKVFGKVGLGYNLDFCALVRLEDLITKIFEFNNRKVNIEFFEDHKLLHEFYFKAFHEFFRFDRKIKLKNLFKQRDFIYRTQMKTRVETLKRHFELIQEYTKREQANECG